MADYDLWSEIQSKTKQLDYSVKELRKSGTAYAEAERAYKVKLRETALRLRSQDMAVGMINAVSVHMHMVHRATSFRSFLHYTPCLPLSQAHPGDIRQKINTLTRKPTTDIMKLQT